MRGFRSTGESADGLELDEGSKPSPGKRSLTAGLVSRKEAGPDDGEVDTRGINALLERSGGGGGGGAPLPDPLRGSFEESLGVRLADVRVHTGGESAEAASSINARAFTVGQDVHFAQGQYQPGTQAGNHLIAHEVAHTIQQRGSAPQVQAKLTVGDAGSPAEREADAVADRVAGGAAPVGGSSDPTALSTGGGKVKVTVKVTRKAGTMEYDAADYKELYKQVSARAQANKCAGQCDCGAANCNFVTYDPGNGGTVEAREMSIEVEITVTVPTWKQRGSAPPEHQAKFDAWAKSVAAHEELHYNVYKTGFDQMKSVIKGPTESDCNTQYDAQMAATEKLQEPIDKNQQPAPLDIPGGIEKVP